jgi:abhydrolase domain-containing protein 12
MVNWALTVARLPPERILLLGQSLGTAVATAAAEHFSKTTPQVDFAGLMLVAGFSDLPTLMLTYSIGGFFPLLSPLRPYPAVQRWFAGQMADKWNTVVRLANYVRRSRKVNLIIIHSKNDPDISWTHSDVLFHVAANATSQEGLTVGQINPMKTKFNLGEGGLVNTWRVPNKTIRQEIVKYGGTDCYTSWHCEWLLTPIQPTIEL